MMIPALVEVDDAIDPFNYNASRVVNGFYRELMMNEIKDAWKRRSSFLNDRPRTGLFGILPAQVLQEHFIRKSLQLECRQFQHMLERALTCGNMQDASHQQFKLSYASIVESQSIQQTHVANTLLCLMFGNIFRKTSQSHEVVI